MGVMFHLGRSVTNIDSLYSCERKIGANKKSFVLLEHIRSQISLTWERSLKLANNQSANFVVKQNAQLLFLGKCTLVLVKYASQKNQLLEKMF